MWRVGVPPGFEDVARLWRGSTTEDRLKAANTMIEAGYQLVGSWNPQSPDMPEFKWWEPEPPTIDIYDPNFPWLTVIIGLALIVGLGLVMRR